MSVLSVFAIGSCFHMCYQNLRTHFENLRIVFQWLFWILTFHIDFNFASWEKSYYSSPERTGSQKRGTKYTVKFGLLRLRFVSLFVLRPSRDPVPVRRQPSPLSHLAGTDWGALQGLSGGLATPPVSARRARPATATSISPVGDDSLPKWWKWAVNQMTRTSVVPLPYVPAAEAPWSWSTEGERPWAKGLKVSRAGLCLRWSSWSSSRSLFSRWTWTR